MRCKRTAGIVLAMLLGGCRAAPFSSSVQPSPVPGFRVASLEGPDRYVIEEEDRVWTARSSDPSFLERTRARKGVLAVTRDRAFQVISPEAIRPTLSIRQQSCEADPMQGEQWGLRQIEAPQAWRYATGKGVRVAIVDTGIDPDNPDLKPNLDLAAGGSVIDYGPDKDAGIKDLMGHGSHVAGIVAAARNSWGTVGVAPEATIIPIKAATWDGGGTVGDAIDGIELAIAARADIINLSLEFPFDPKKPDDQALARALRRTLERAKQRGILVVCAAGNEATDLDEKPLLPISVSPGLGVSATGPVGQQNFDAPASYSNYGQAVDLCAPGGNVSIGSDGVPQLVDLRDLVLSTWSTHALPQQFQGIPLGPADHMYMIGTSMAAPHVAGVAALVLSRYPHLSLARLTHQLLATADDLGGKGRDPHCGRGRVNALAAVQSIRF